MPWSLATRSSSTTLTATTTTSAPATIGTICSRMRDIGFLSEGRVHQQADLRQRHPEPGPAARCFIDVHQTGHRSGVLGHDREADACTTRTQDGVAPPAIEPAEHPL